MMRAANTGIQAFARYEHDEAREYRGLGELYYVDGRVIQDGSISSNVLHGSRSL